MDMIAFLRGLDIKALFAGAALALTLRELLARALKERRRRAAFVGVSLEHNGERIHIVWDGPLNTIDDERAPRLMSASLQKCLTASIQQHSGDALQGLLDFLPSVKGLPVFETNAAKTWKRRLQSDTDRRSHLFVWRRTQ